MEEKCLPLSQHQPGATQEPLQSVQFQLGSLWQDDACLQAVTSSKTLACMLPQPWALDPAGMDTSLTHFRRATLGLSLSIAIAANIPFT